MTTIGYEHKEGNVYEFVFKCDFPRCNATISLNGRKYDERDTIEDIAGDALHHEAKHGEWGPRSTFGFYCPEHVDIVRDIRESHYALIEASKLEDKADRIRFRLREKGVYEEVIEEVDKFEGYMD